MKLMNTRRAPKKIARTIRTVTVVTVLCFCLSILRGSEVVSPKSAGNDPTKLHPVTKGPMGWGIFQKMHKQQRDEITAATPGSSTYVKEYEDVMKWLVNQLKKKT